MLAFFIHLSLLIFAVIRGEQRPCHLQLCALYTFRFVMIMPPALFLWSRPHCRHPHVCPFVFVLRTMRRRSDVQTEFKTTTATATTTTTAPTKQYWWGCNMWITVPSVWFVIRAFLLHVHIVSRWHTQALLVGRMTDAVRGRQLFSAGVQINEQQIRWHCKCGCSRAIHRILMPNYFSHRRYGLKVLWRFFNLFFVDNLSGMCPLVMSISSQRSGVCIMLFECI